MATSNRADLLTKTHKTLKKHYTAETPNLKRPLMEQMLFACCLEDGPADAALKAYEAVQDSCFDWNEVRVSTVTELAEFMKGLPEPSTAASRLKRVLQSVFESDYTFELEKLKKENIGVAVKKLTKFDGVTPFVTSYTVQTSLGGHSIPVGRGALAVLYAVGVINEKELEARNVPGLERAIAKSKGIEFGSLLHQIGVDFDASPFSPSLKKLLQSIAPDAAERLPKRAVKKKPVKKEKETATKTKKAEPKAKKKPAPKKKTTKTVKKAKLTKKKAVKKKTTKTTKTAKPTKATKKTTKKKKASTKRLAKKKPR